jgi:flagellar hook assembly protein FlgD
MHTNLSIYNIAGKLVTTLLNEPLDAGNREIAWDGTNDRGSKVVSGVFKSREHGAHHNNGARLVEKAIRGV